MSMVSSLGAQKNETVRHGVDGEIKRELNLDDGN